jgi:hypothetical protein
MAEDIKNIEDKSTQPIRVTEEMMAKQATNVNQLLRELENNLTPEQHDVLTRFFAERAVLNAMKMRMTLDETGGKENGNE